MKIILWPPTNLTMWIADYKDKHSPRDYSSNWNTGDGTHPGGSFAFDNSHSGYGSGIGSIPTLGTGESLSQEQRRVTWR